MAGSLLVSQCDTEVVRHPGSGCGQMLCPLHLEHGKCVHRASSSSGNKQAWALMQPRKALGRR